MKIQQHIISIIITTIVFHLISPIASAQNTGEILIIPKNTEEVISEDGIKFSENGKVTFPSGTIVKVDFDLESPDNSIREDDKNKDK